MTNWFVCLQWKAEIHDFCPSTRILLIGCKTDLRTDVCTRMELSNQKQTPISHEQVCPMTISCRTAPRLPAETGGTHSLPCAGSLSNFDSLISPSTLRDRPWPSSSEPRPTWSVPPSRPRRASTASFVLRLRPASAKCSLRTSPARCAASPRDSYTFPAGRSCSPPRSARTSPRVAPLCKHC